MKKDLKNIEGKIAYIITLKSGMESFVYRELEILKKRNVDFILYITKNGPPDIYSPKKEWKVEKIISFKTLKRLPIIFFTILKKFNLLLESILDRGFIEFIIAVNYSISMRKNNIRHIHTHFGDRKFFIGYYCKKILKINLSVTIHAHEIYCNPNEKLFKKALLYSNQIFSISRKWKEKLIKKYPINKNKIKVQRLFADSKLFSSKFDNYIYILAVGRFTERKGFKYLIDAANINKQKNYRYIFVGWGKEELQEYTNKLELDKIITFFPKLDEKQLSLLYKFADIFCVPSITTKKEGGEGIPVVLMEAMSCGLPVISTLSGATDELVKDYIIRERSANDIAQKIDLLASDINLRLKQGKKNQRIVKTSYSIKNFESLYNYFLDSIKKN